MPFFKVLNDTFKSNKLLDVIKIVIVGGSSLILSLYKYIDVFDDEDYQFYNSLEKSDLDIHIFIKDENDKQSCRSISEKVMFKYKEQLLTNIMFIYYLHTYVTDYLNEKDDFKNENNVKKIRKILVTNNLKYEDTEKRKNAFDLPINQVKDDIFIRISENNKYSETSIPIDLYRLLTNYEATLNNEKKLSIWVELIEIELITISHINDNDFNKAIKNIENIIKIIEINILENKNTDVEDIPKTNNFYIINNILFKLIEKNDNQFIHEVDFNDIKVIVLTVKGYLYENILILLNTPDDPKTKNRLKKVQSIIKILKKIK